jgi:hypothetical protein
MRRALAIAASALLALPAAAVAGPPGKWTKVTGLDYTASNIDELGLARTADGVLHVVYVKEPGGAGAAQLLHGALSADARQLLGPHAIVTFGGLNQGAALTAGPGGLRAFFAGTNDLGTPFAALSNTMSTATSTDGSSWVVAPGPVSNSTPAGASPVYAGDGISATLAADGTPVSAWGDSAPGGAGYHLGLDPAAPDQRFPMSGCCLYNPAVAVDAASGQLVAAWYANASPGAFVQHLPGGQATRAPSSSAAGQSQRMGLSGRLGAPGVYLAYTAGANPFDGRPALWRVGSAKPTVLRVERGARFTGIAPAPGGRLWVFWALEQRLYAARTNPAATRFGAIVSIKAPKGTDNVWRLAGEASLGPLDLLVHLSRSDSDLGSYHQRILPGLLLSVTKTKGAVVLKVTDAGAAVQGAKVTLAGRGKKKKATTGKSGKVTFKTPVAGKYSAVATKGGYAKATHRLTVK